MSARGVERASVRLGAVAFAYGLDRIIGEPPAALHPLRAFGHAMSSIEHAIYADEHLRGAYFATAGTAIGALAGAALSSTVAATFLAVGGRSLAESATALALPLRDGDLVTARVAVRQLVGRDPEHLGESELARAAVESVAENTVDAIIAPLCFAAIAGAPGALGYRAVNTLDAMVGYRNTCYRRFGWASARLDDCLNFIPARITALLVVLVRPRHAREVLRIVRRDARAHPSPNAGVAESAFAAALGLRVGGENSYGGVVETRGFLGDGRPPKAGDIARAVRLSRDVGLAAAAIAGFVSVACRVHLRKSSPRERAAR